MVLFDHPSQVPLFFIHIVVNVAETLLLVWLYGHIYGRPRKSTRFMVLLAVGLILLLSCALRVLLPPRRSISGASIPIIASLPLLAFYNRASWKKRLLMSLLLFTLSFVYSDLTNYLTTPYIWTHAYLMELLGNAVFWVLIALVRWAGGKDRAAIPASMNALLGAISAVSIGLLLYIRYQSGRQENPFGGVIEVPVYVTLLFINLSLFLLFGNLAALMRQAQEKSLLEQQLRLQEEHYRQMEKSQERIRTLHHDMKNHLAAAAQLAAQSGDAGEVGRYLQNASAELRAYEQSVRTGNPVMDSLLNVKLAELAAEGIRVQTAFSVPPGLNLPFERAVSILGNLLDNVREACRTLEEGEHRARIAISYLNHSLAILVENAAPEAPARWRDGLPLSTKGEQSLHGHGLRNVRNAVEPGSMEVYWSRGRFVVEIVLYDIDPGRAVGRCPL